MSNVLDGFDDTVAVLNDTGIRPIQDRVSVKRVPKKQPSQFLYAPEGSEDWPPIGLVLAVGPRVKDPEIRPGIKVLFKTRPSSAIFPDDREGCPEKWERVVQLREEDILGIVEE